MASETTPMKKAPNESHSGVKPISAVHVQNTNENKKLRAKGGRVIKEET